jgi:hypothetical protein
MTIEIKEFRNPVFLAHGFIDCEINHPVLGWIWFTADRNDTGAQFDVAELFDRMVASGTVAPYVPPPQEVIDAEKAAEVRGEREWLLQTVVDPFVSNPLRWADLTPEKQAAVAAYRRALLDITEQSGFPHNVTWPEQP